MVDNPTDEDINDETSDGAAEYEQGDQENPGAEADDGQSASLFEQVMDQKNFPDKETFAKSYSDSQEHIQTLQSRLDKLEGQQRLAQEVPIDDDEEIDGLKAIENVVSKTIDKRLQEFEAPRKAREQYEKNVRDSETYLVQQGGEKLQFDKIKADPRYSHYLELSGGNAIVAAQQLLGERMINMQMGNDSDSVQNVQQNKSSAQTLSPGGATKLPKEKDESDVEMDELDKYANKWRDE